MANVLFVEKKYMASGIFNYKDGIKLLNYRDLILIFIIISISVIMFYKDTFSQSSDYLIVSQANKVIGRYALSENQTIIINQGTELEIENGKYRLTKSQCQEQICVKMGWCRTNPIVCVPQSLVIAPEKRDEGKIITY